MGSFSGENADDAFDDNLFHAIGTLHITRYFPEARDKSLGGEQKVSDSVKILNTVFFGIWVINPFSM